MRTTVQHSAFQEVIPCWLKSSVSSIVPTAAALVHILGSGQTDLVYAVAISREEDTIVSGSSDNTVRVWDAGSGELRHTLEGHTSNMRAVVVSQDGGTIISGSDDKTVRIWDAHSGEYYCGIYTEGSIKNVAITPDGSRIIAGGDGGVYFLKFEK
jgi:WD40 repeat protein